MCEFCPPELNHKLWKGEFWIDQNFVPLEDFFKKEETYRKSILSLEKRVWRGVCAIDPTILKIKVEIWPLSDSCLLLLYKGDSVNLRPHVLIRGKLFWKHRLEQGLHLFCPTKNGQTITRTKTLEKADEKIKYIQKNICL